MFGSFQHFAKEPIGGIRIPFGTEHEVDRLAGGIDHAVEIIPFPFDFDVGFIDAIGVVRESQVRTNSFLQFRSIGLNPPVDRRMIDREAAFIHHFFEIAITEGVA